MACGRTISGSLCNTGSERLHTLTVLALRAVLAATGRAYRVLLRTKIRQWRVDHSAPHMHVAIVCDMIRLPVLEWTMFPTT